MIQAQKDYPKVKDLLIKTIRTRFPDRELLYSSWGVTVNQKRRKHLLLKAIWTQPDAAPKASAFILSLVTADTQGKLIATTRV